LIAMMWGGGLGCGEEAGDGPGARADGGRGLGRTPGTSGDRAGFVANGRLGGYLNQAAGMLESGHATRDDIDAAMKAGAGLPMGPVTLMDLIGLATRLAGLDPLRARLLHPPCAADDGRSVDLGGRPPLQTTKHTTKHTEQHKAT
ncbi:3-hydroxyacyl-CoA dehydrogenase family protein, partial [Actinomadura sp. BRA 177]|uniref:3-hydroxyacyl-CoA dehydrogenase family protein n=1 Tax=Actinomadura sp. BRA 177 TaxID=2745202 RepID=UPI0017A5AAB3